MSILAIPALVALLSKLWIYALAKNTRNTSQTFLWLLLFFAIHNLSEFLLISQFFDGKISDLLLELYYVAAIFSVAYMYVFSSSVANRDTAHKLDNLIVLVIALVTSAFVISSDLIVAGTMPAKYAVTAIKGSYYFIFQFIAISGFALTLYTLTRRYLTVHDSNVQLRCFYAIIALSPIIITSLIIIIMMRMDYPYTAVVLIPLSTTLFLALSILTQKHNDLMSISHRLPFSSTRLAEKEFLTIFRSHMDGKIGLVETKSALEKVLIQSALDKSHGNVTHAANKLMIKRSTLYSIVNRLEMKKALYDNDQ